MNRKDAYREDAYMRNINILLILISTINIFIVFYWLTGNIIASITFAFALLGYRMSFDL